MPGEQDVRGLGDLRFSILFATNSTNLILTADCTDFILHRRKRGDYEDKQKEP
jgi:hypothetical protein